MAITIDDFSKIWASTSPLTPYSFSESDYKEGWSFIGQIPPSRQMWDFLQKNNDEKMQYLANHYLPLSGGTMTGAITCSGDLVQNSLDTSWTRFNGGTAYNNGANLTLWGKSHTSAGKFQLQANDGTNTKNLVGISDGTLTWGGQNILTASNYNSYALPLSGGTITGSITTNTYLPLRMSRNNSWLQINGGTTNSDGASLILFGKEESRAGGFWITAHNGTTSKVFSGSADGTLTWNGQPLLPVGIVQAFAGNTIPNGWLLCDGSAVSRTTYANLYACIGDTYGAGDGSTTFNLPNLVDKFVEGSTTAGTVKNAGLPEIFGKLKMRNATSGAQNIWDYAGTAFKAESISDSSSGLTSGANPGTATEITLSAQSYNPIYGNSTTVQPPALTMQYIIKY